jgi:hypothetical protein
MSCCLTAEEVHRIAYLTMRGWSLFGNDWSREGFERDYEVSRGCGCCFESRKSPFFNLEQAYEAQIGRE